MRIMAADAAFAGHHGLVFKPHALGFFVDILVAFKTDFVAGFFKNRFVIRGVRIVALQTIAFGHNFMGTAGFFGQHRLVTAAAQLGDIRGQQHFVGRGVRIVAVGTFAGFDGCMNGTALEGFLKRFVTLQAYFTLGPGFQLEFAGRHSRRRNHKRTRQAKGDNDRKAKIYTD